MRMGSHIYKDAPNCSKKRYVLESRAPTTAQASHMRMRTTRFMSVQSSKEEEKERSVMLRCCVCLRMRRLRTFRLYIDDGVSYFRSEARRCGHFSWL